MVIIDFSFLQCYTYEHAEKLSLYFTHLI